jgi:hypothetical protein
MTRSASGNLGASSKPTLKSPLRVATMPLLLPRASDATPDPVREAARSARQATTSATAAAVISQVKVALSWAGLIDWRTAVGGLPSELARRGFREWFCH